MRRIAVTALIFLCSVTTVNAGLLNKLKKFFVSVLVSTRKWPI
jgi:hypothetical protein